MIAILIVDINPIIIDLKVKTKLIIFLKAYMKNKIHLEIKP